MGIAVGAWALTGFAGLAAAGVSGLGFVSGFVETDAFGSTVFGDSGDVFVLQPMTSFYSYIETDQGFAEARGEMLVGGGRSVIDISLNAVDSSTINMDIVFQVPEETTFQLEAGAGLLFFEAVSGALSFDDGESGTIAAGTYRIAGDQFGDEVIWRLRLDREFALVPAPGGAVLAGLALGAASRRRRAGC
jgi:hypothetical protein